MAVLTLTFSSGLNTDVQVGDTAYYVATTTSGTGGYTSNISGATSNSIVEIGTVLTVNFATNVITITTSLADNTVTTSHFILFSKDNAVNISSVLGYYAEVKMVNTSTSAAELYQIGTSMFESSGNS
tara:strand:- start:384 stop:764 length:381 start_codon:yes stop_codon:yes gene_type:complete